MKTYVVTCDSPFVTPPDSKRVFEVLRDGCESHTYDWTVDEVKTPFEKQIGFEMKEATGNPANPIDLHAVTIDGKEYIRKDLIPPCPFCEKLRAENAELQTTHAILKGKLDFTYCAYCGEAFKVDSPDAIDAISKHIATCAKHPMRKLEAENEELKTKIATVTEILERALRNMKGE